MRILYVALTRAIDRLEIVGTVKDLDSLDEEQAGKRSFLDMVYAPLKLTGEEICVEHLASEEGADELQETGTSRRHSAKDLMQQLQRTAQRAGSLSADSRRTIPHGTDRCRAVLSISVQ